MDDNIRELNIVITDINKKIKELEEYKNKIENEIKEKTLLLLESKKDSLTKNDIVILFNLKVKGNEYTKNTNTNDGKEGIWLEKLMNIKTNCYNKPDICGYEMKKYSDKISFGDWSASEYLFSINTVLLDEINGEKINITKEEFIKYFGTKNEDKESRYSWSGSCVPKYNKWNECGQILQIDDNNNIMAMYSYDKDKRNNKNDTYKNKHICIAIWHHKKIKKHVEDKFNQKGFFVCKKNKDNIYDKICFGSPIDYSIFIENIKSGNIFFDSGLYNDDIKPNTRMYSHWRAHKNFWNNLIIEEY